MKPETEKATGNSQQRGGEKPDSGKDDTKGKECNCQYCQFTRKPTPRMLPTVTLDNGKTYFVDARLREMRNVKNPHDRIDFRSIIK
jgi:hypothetical protein